MDAPRSQAQQLQSLQAEYESYRGRGLRLDMTRGKPCSEQLDLVNGLLDGLDGHYRATDGTDCRNYGGIDGIPEAKALFAEFLEVAPDELIVGDNSSLALMHDTILRLLLVGVSPQARPWLADGPVKFICPVPGYDRHFAICQTFGIEMINVDLNADGPDMQAVTRLVAADERIKGIWVMPKYNNPTGITFSDAVIDTLASMPTKAADFRIFCDNAYIVHHLYDTPDPLKNLLAACKAAGNPDRVFIFGSTSKVTFAGAGIALLGASKANVDYLKKLANIQTIGPNKLNQLRHVRYLKDMDGIKALMRQHAEIIRPKFELVLDILASELGDSGQATWNRPRGGYFISVDTQPGCAARIVQLADQAGVKLTPAGATFPYGRDPLDRNIRIAPTLPSLAELDTATRLFALCVKIAALEKSLAG